MTARPYVKHELFYDDDSETKTERHYSRPHTPSPRHSDHLPPTQHYPPEIELHLEPMTPYIAPPIPASSPELHSTMLSHRFLPLPLPQGFQANNVRSHGHVASPPDVQLHDSEIKEPRRYQSRDVPELPQIMEVAHGRHVDQGLYSPTAPGSALPLLTPAMPRAEQTMRYDQQHRPSRSDPEFTRQPLGPPVSFARSYSTPTDSSFPAEGSGSLRQFASPTSKRNLFNSAAVYNSWIGSLHPTPMHHRRYSQQLNHRVGDLLPYHRPVHDRHLVEQQEPLGHVVDYEPSSSASGRRASYHQTMQRENVPRYADSPPPRTYHTTTPQKVKVRRKQGPSVKKTEVGMACQFCRRRKIRCSGDLPKCSNCVRLNKTLCEYMPVSAEGSEASGSRRSSNTHKGKEESTAMDQNRRPSQSRSEMLKAESSGEGGGGRKVSLSTQFAAARV